jgi:superfamily I DNA/RNA helicase
MPQSYLIFDFAGNEEAAQQARHRIDGWKQAFRLGRKLELRFDRQIAGEKKEVSEKNDKKKKAAKPAEEAPAHLRLIVRLDFSDHEKLSHTRWLERIPAEAPFHGLPVEIVYGRDESFEKTAALFDSLG